MSSAVLAARCADIVWPEVAAALDRHGAAIIDGLLDGATCSTLAAAYDDGATPFRSRIVMARHGFGSGEYKYFDHPLPPAVAVLRNLIYPPLAAIANDWAARLRLETRYPASHAAYLERCHAAGQQRPTPLLLRYQADDYNCLHQDLYGAEVFPLQIAVLLSDPENDFSGGEFVLTEQRPRQQSRVEVVPLRRGDAVVFPVQHRPMAGSRGTHRVTLRHGVSRLRSGTRLTLGVIFHDAH